ncbi:hypothetical protein D8B26_005204 [Coccidioides posadasii str. Silveira]|uniref:LYC1 C-terminal domain-containing protein n=1 Tax=Coccidioides posadasii (strain RMSCC 757 / Silveira) TaxID=443226 RepID=E9D675_COCPS|nr:conserved hypothetical protein [Coccidioides posadasii str. Silveira]QVM10546.1 hypothetical protein D8B26_005204 [Coccidioides posadasii str. Silveira]
MKKCKGQLFLDRFKLFESVLTPDDIASAVKTPKMGEDDAKLQGAVLEPSGGLALKTTEQLAGNPGGPESTAVHDDIATLPDATSPDLHLSHPTDQENSFIWKLQSVAWKDALTVPQFIEGCAYVTTLPLAKNKGMTQWILVDKTLPPGRRQILASCESVRKRSLTSDANGNVTETITHGVASVYCNPRYRRRGYASRMLTELGKVLATWQVEGFTKVAASVLFSDIGSKFYAAVGWQPFSSYHIEFSPAPLESRSATCVLAEEVGQLCADDESIIRQAMARPYKDGRARHMILPDHDHMLWHHHKEEFDCEKLLAKKPHIKGAIAGEPGNRVWAIWIHRFYKSPDGCSGNVLYILRLVIENTLLLDDFSDDNKRPDLPVKELRAVLQAAQAEAANWKLQHVKLWDPSPLAEELIKRTGIDHRRVVRENDGICCLRWYGDGDEQEKSLSWIGKQKYCWC